MCYLEVLVHVSWPGGQLIYKNTYCGIYKNTYCGIDLSFDKDS